jgi:hypothetical protein
LVPLSLLLSRDAAIISHLALAWRPIADFSVATSERFRLGAQDARSGRQASVNRHGALANASIHKQQHDHVDADARRSMVTGTGVLMVGGPSAARWIIRLHCHPWEREDLSVD